MKPDRLKQLLNEVISQMDVTPEGAVHIFETLVKTTLNYRDILKVENGITLTVGDTREALNLLIEYINYKHLPQTENFKAFQLLKLWIHELNLDKLDEESASKTMH